MESDQDTTSAEKAKELSRKWFIDVFNENNTDIIDEILAEDCTFHGPQSLGADDPKEGREGARWFAENFNTLAPDSEFTIHDIFSDGERVAVRWTMEATHEGGWPPMDVEPTGAKVEIRGNNIHHVEDGEIVDIWPQQDTLKMVQAIGAVELK